MSQIVVAPISVSSNAEAHRRVSQPSEVASEIDLKTIELTRFKSAALRFTVRYLSRAVDQESNEPLINTLPVHTMELRTSYTASSRILKFYRDDCETPAVIICCSRDQGSKGPWKVAGILTEKNLGTKEYYANAKNSADRPPRI